MTNDKSAAAPKTVAFSKNAANIFFHILTRCNLRCRHCYINPGQHGENTLPLSTIIAWMKAFTEKHPAPNIIFLGGEPTLHPDLAPAVKAARDLGYGSVTVDTNGFLFNDILNRVEPDEVDFFSFSLDGATRQTNDAIRGKGSYDACVTGAKKAAARGFSTSLIYTISQDNIHELPLMPPLLAELEIKRFFIQVLGLRGKSAIGGGHLPRATRSQWLKVIPDAAREAARLGIPSIYPKVFLNEDEPFECAGLAADNYFIFPNGRVYRCPLCEDHPLHGMAFEGDRLKRTPKINEFDLFRLSIPEGCVMNKLVQPDNLVYTRDGAPKYKIACCMLKEEVSGGP